MNYQKIQEILENIDPSEWLSFDKNTQFTYKNDVNLRIKKFEYWESTWLFSKEPIPLDSKMHITVHYGSSLVYEKWMIYLDSYKATLPIPCSSTMLVSRMDYHISLLVNGNHRNKVDDYLKISDLTIE